MKKFEAPIPGQSLTMEPGNSPWEQPPLYNTKEEALGFYLDKFEDDEMIEDLFFSFEQGMPVSAVVEGLTSMGVMEGYHTVDVKMIISPYIHEYLKTMAEAADINFKESWGKSKEELMAEKKKKRLLTMIETNIKGSSSPVSEEKVEEAEELMEEDVENFEEAPEAPAPTGLIPRRK